MYLIVIKYNTVVRLYCYSKRGRELKNIKKINTPFLSIIYLLSLVLVSWPMIGFGASWRQIGSDIEGEVADDNSGSSVSLNSDGTVVAIGAPFNDGNGDFAGHVRVFQNLSDTWTQIGLDIDGETAEDRSGYSVSLSSDGTVVAIGAYNNDGNGSNAGHVRIYQNVSGTWTQVGLDIDGEAAEDWSGYSVSLSGDGTVVAIGARRNDGNGSNAGHVRIYQNVSGTWTQVGSDIEGETPGDESGWSVSLSGDGTVVAIGTTVDNDNNGSNAGHVRVYRNVSGFWTRIGPDIDGEATGDQSGVSVSLSDDGTIVSIGARYNDGNGSNAGHVKVFMSFPFSWSIFFPAMNGNIKP